MARGTSMERCHRLVWSSFCSSTSSRMETSIFYLTSTLLRESIGLVTQSFPISVTIQFTCLSLFHSTVPTPCQLIDIPVPFHCPHSMPTHCDVPVLPFLFHAISFLSLFHANSFMSLFDYPYSMLIKSFLPLFHSAIPIHFTRLRSMPTHFVPVPFQLPGSRRWT